MNQNYLKLNSTSNLRDSLLTFAKNSTTNWIRKNGFDIAMVPRHLIENDAVVSKLSLKFKSVPVIFRMPAWQFYRFHTDEVRSCALNMLLEGDDSQTYYGTTTDDEELMNITELIYERDTYYLLNTHIKHAVVNRNNVRYMFSMGFNDPLTFNLVVNFCQEHSL